MTNLLFPGRHLLQTAFQAQYLRSTVQIPLESLQFLPGQRPPAAPPIDTVIFAITSANHQFTRYNPIPFHVRAIGVDRFARTLAEELDTRYRIFGIPHYAPSPRFATILLKEIAEQTEGNLHLTPENTVVLTSTLPVAAMFQQLGFAVLPAELTTSPRPSTPQQVLTAVMQAGAEWDAQPALVSQLAPSTLALWRGFPEVTRRVQRLWRDPLLTDDGSLTETRNYATYAQAMSNAAIIDVKYSDIRQHITPGRIVDEGCADGALLVRVAADFPDSDLIGIEITGELLARCLERQRAGEFGETFVHFHQRNIIEPVFMPNTIHTTICNSTLHELWSYNDRAATVHAYLREKFRQTAPRGRLLIRDVVGPEDRDRTVYLWLDDQDGTPWDKLTEDTVTPVSELSTFARFFRFAADFLPQRRAASNAAAPVVPFAVDTVEGQRYIVTTLQLAVEFITKMDYVDNWASEMHEEFAFWSMADWRTALQEAGFSVRAESHDYTNPWIVAHRWQGRVRLYHRGNGKLSPLPYPPTTVVLVAEKPGHDLDLPEPY